MDLSADGIAPHVQRDSKMDSGADWISAQQRMHSALRNPVQRGQRFHGKGDSNPVKADSR